MSKEYCEFKYGPAHCNEEAKYTESYHGELARVCLVHRRLLRLQKKADNN
jgi:hypothetical protein